MLVSKIGQAIKERRRQLKITQSYLAEIAEISINTLYKLETGQTNVTVDVLEKILDVLGMELKLEVKKLNE